MPITLTVTGDSAASILHDLKLLAGGLPASAPISLPELLAKQGADLSQPLPVLNTNDDIVGSIGPIAEVSAETSIAAEGTPAPAPAPETTEQKRKRRGKAEMEAARVFEAFATENAAGAASVLSKFGIDDVADIGPDRAAALVAAVEEAKKPVETGEIKDLDTEAEDDLMGNLDEATVNENSVTEPWLLKGADGNRYDAYSTPEEWCESLAALIASADTAADIKALATVNAGIKDRMEAAGKIDLLRDVIDGGRARMAALEAKPAGDAPTVQDCAAALRAYLDPNRTSKLTSDERTSKASEILKVQFGAPKVASLKPEQYAAFIAALAEAGAE